jgi:hypothetical protein
MTIKEAAARLGKAELTVRRLYGIGVSIHPSGHSAHWN